MELTLVITKDPNMNDKLNQIAARNGDTRNGDTRNGDTRNGDTRKKKDTKNNCCGCYKEDSTDTRCFGLCYFFCPAKNIDKELDSGRCDICPNHMKEYIKSGYFNTENDGLCTVLCLPIKIPLFFPCILGSACNNFINCVCKTDRNYLI